MKILLESKDIYDVSINDVDTGNFYGWPTGYNNFYVDVDDIIQDGDITIKISGDCTYFGYHTDNSPCTFEGTLTINEDEFNYKYTHAAEDGAKYITFEGNIKISPEVNNIELDTDCDVKDTFADTIKNIHSKLTQELEDDDYIISETIQYLLKGVADQIIEEIKHIDNINIDKDEYINYVLQNIVEEYNGELIDDKYESINIILNTQITEQIKNGKITEFINDLLDDEILEGAETCEIIAKVFFSDLDL